MAGKRGKSKGQRDAQGLMSDGLQATSSGPGPAHQISCPPQGILAAPLLISLVGDVANHNLVEGGPSICRDGDPLPLLCPVSGAWPLQAASSHSQSEAALKVFVESPSTELPSLNPVPSGPVVDLCCSEPPKTRPMRSYADVVSNAKESNAESKSKTSSADPRVKFAEGKSSFNKSFLDDGGTNTFGQILEIDGRKVVTFSIEELDELAAPFEFTLVGKFSHGFPTMKTLKSIMGNLNLRGRFSVSLLEHKHVLFLFSCEEDYTRFWSRQVWHMAGFPMRVLKWTPDFDPLVEASFAPVWVKFPYLPIHLFDKRSLFPIASVLGKPLRIDSSTADLSRASTPRVCVEIDLSQSLLPEVEINLGGKTLIQLVEYENIPEYCSTCKHLGHGVSDCKSLKKVLPESRPSAKMAADQQGPGQADVLSKSRELIEVHDSASLKDVSVLDGSISFDSKGILNFTPACINPLDNPVNVSKIRDDIFQSYEQFDDPYDAASVCLSLHHFTNTGFVGKDSFSVGDCNSDSEPIILPTKNKVKKKSKKNNTVKPTQVEERFDEMMPLPEQEIIGTTEEVEGYIEVVNKFKKKKGKEKKNPG